MTRQQERVKLHVTLMNSRFRQHSDDSGDDMTPKARESFCARKILQVSRRHFKCCHLSGSVVMVVVMICLGRDGTLSGSFVV